MRDDNSRIILDLARELLPNLTKGLEQVLIEFGTQLLLRTRNIPVAWWNPKTDEVGLGVVDWEDTGCIPLSIARQISRTDQLTPNVEVQRDSGGIIAGGSAGTTGYASAVKTEEDK